MAYVPHGLKSVLAGSGKAPAVFTYNGGSDTIANVTTEGYFDAHGGSGIFEVNDIIYSKVNSGASFIKMVCVQNDKEANLGSKLNFSSASTFVGDVRATDDAGYQSDNMGVGLGSAQGVFMTYTYRNNTDDLATIAGADYFADAGIALTVGDVIEVVGNDGLQMLMVTARGNNTATTRVITFV